MIRTAVLTVLCAVTVLAPGVRSAEITAGDVRAAMDHVRHAERAWRVQRADRAKAHYSRALGVIRSFPEAHVGLGRIAMQEGRFEDALRHYQAAHDGYGDVDEALFLFRAGRYARAQSRIQELRDKIRELQAPRTSRGDARYQISKLENEIEFLESILPPTREGRAEPPGEIYFHIGNALFRLERLNEAITAWETCRDASPDFGPNFNNLALGYWRQGRIRDAISCLERAVELDFPVNPGFEANLRREAGLDSY